MKTRTICVSYAILMEILQERSLRKTFMPSGGKDGKFFLYLILDHFDDL